VNTALISISAITVLMIIGLGFFIRASVKERTEQLSFSLTEPVDAFLPKLQNHLVGRSYRLVNVSEDAGVIYEGLVSPSWFMAIFLTSLAAGGLLCLGLMMSYWLPAIGNWFLTLTMLAPLAGNFYWQKATRPEQVNLRIASMDSRTIVTVTGHRDELSVLEKNLAIEPLESLA
jgi:Cofactor assembly of complex C subunit B